MLINDLLNVLTVSGVVNETVLINNTTPGLWASQAAASSSTVCASLMSLFLTPLLAKYPVNPSRV